MVLVIGNGNGNGIGNDNGIGNGNDIGNGNGIGIGIGNVTSKSDEWSAIKEKKKDEKKVMKEKVPVS